jgi:hypothetical protein
MVITVIVPEGRNYCKSSRQHDVNRPIGTKLLYEIAMSNDGNGRVGTHLFAVIRQIIMFSFIVFFPISLSTTEI